MDFLQDEKNQIVTTNAWLNLVSEWKVPVPQLGKMSLFLDVAPFIYPRTQLMLCIHGITKHIPLEPI